MARRKPRLALAACITCGGLFRPKVRAYLICPACVAKETARQLETPAAPDAASRVFARKDGKLDL